MKKFCLLMAAIACLATPCIAQDVKEPDFVGEAIIYNKETNEVVNLATETPQEKTKANAAMYLTGLGSVKTKWVLEGSTSSAKIGKAEELFIIVRGDNNSYSPSSYIRIFKFDESGKRRMAEIAKLGTFTGHSENNQDYIPFQATKYGESSYLIKVKNIEAGEYGVKIESDTNMISTFSVIDPTAQEQPRKAKKAKDK